MYKYSSVSEWSTIKSFYEPLRVKYFEKRCFKRAKGENGTLTKAQVHTNLSTIFLQLGACV